MITFLLKRYQRTDKHTFGVLSEPTFGWKCATVEKMTPKSWQGITAGQKSKCCLPCGEYSLLLRYDMWLHPYFDIAIGGVYKNSTFNPTTPHSAGCVGIGSKYEFGGWCEKGEDVFGMLSDYIQQLIDRGLIPTRPKRGVVTLRIEEAETLEYIDFKGKSNEDDEWDEEDWNMMD